MKAAKIVGGVAGLVMIVMVGIVVYLSLTLERHKGLLESSVSTALGRKVRIEGGVKVHWSMRPSVDLIDLRVGNPAWASGEYLARVGRTVLRFDAGSLLHGRLDVDEVMIENADIDLEVGSDGRDNWSFDSGGHGASIDAFEVEGARLSYLSANGHKYPLDITDLDIRRRGDAALAFEARVVLGGIPLSVSGASSPGAGSDHKGWPFSVQVTTDSATLAVSGHAAAAFEYPDISLELHSERLALPGILSAVQPSPAVAGELKKIEARLDTSGGTLRELIENLNGGLRIGSARLSWPPGPGTQARHVDLGDARFTVASGRPVGLKTRVTYAGQGFELDLTGGTLADLFANDPGWKTIEVAAEGRFDQQPLEVSGQIGTLSALLSGRNMAIGLKAQHRGVQARVNGTLARLDGLQGSRLAVEISGPSASLLTPWLGVEIPNSEPFKINARLEGAERSLNLRDISGAIGASDVSGELVFPHGRRPHIEAKLNSRLLDLTPYVTPGDSSGETTGRTLSDELPLESLRALDAVVHWQVGRLRIREYQIDRFRLNGTLDTGHLQVDMQGGEERLSAGIDLKPEETDWRLSLRHKGKLNLSMLVGGEDNSDPRSQAPLAVEADLTGIGRSPAALLGSAEGKLELVVGEGRLSQKVVNIPLGTLLFTLLNAIAPRSESERYARLECAVLHFDIAKGVATSKRGLALRTDAMNAIGAGAIRLQTGEIDIRFKTAQRKGLGISVMGIFDKFLRLVGTLRQPKVEVNPVGVAAEIGAAWASGELSLLFEALVSRLTAFDNPCEIVLKASKE